MGEAERAGLSTAGAELATGISESELSPKDEGMADVGSVDGEVGNVMGDELGERWAANRRTGLERV